MADLFELTGKFVFDNQKGVTDMKNTVSQGQNMESKFSSSMKKVAAAVGGAFAVSKMKEFGQACIDANSVQQQAELKLGTIMKQRMNASESSIQSVKDLASAQQNLGVVGDEVQLSGAQQLSTFLNTDSALKSLIPAMNDLAVQQNGCNVTSENMVSIGNMMGKVMQGQVSALSRVGITFDENQEKILKYGTEEEKAAALAEVITQNVGHMNSEFAKTDDGKIQQAKNTLGDLQETIGAKLVPAQAKLYTAAAKIGTFLVNNVIPALETTGAWMSEHKPLLEGIAVVIGIVTTAMTIQSGVQAVKTAMNAAETTSLSGLIAAKLASAAATMVALAPYLLIAAAIAAVIAIGVLVIKNWDKIKEAAGKLKAGLEEKWNSIKQKTTEVWNGVKNTMSNAMSSAHEYVKGKLDKIKEAYQKNGGGLKGIASATMEGIKQYYSVGYDAINKLTGGKLDKIKEAFGEKMDAAKEKVRGVIEKIKGIFNFNWSLPKLKLPHPKISGKFSLNPPSVPKFSIDWYAKAMNNPMILNSPTAFGMNANGQIMAGGEAGSEVVSGTDTLMNMISQASGGEQVVDILNRMFMFLQEYVPQFANMQLVTDTGVLAGEIAPQIDTELGRIKSLKGRGN